MDRCEEGQDQFAVAVRQGFPYEGTASKPPILCLDAADNNDGKQVAFDVPSGYCTWVGPDNEPGFAVVYEVCEPPPVDFDALGITSQQMGYVWSWGVASVLGLWVVGYVIACGIAAVRRA